MNNHRLIHITPPNDLFPEVGLEPLLKSVCVGKVFEFGCGYGRLASIFAPDSYIGFDINPTALKVAKQKNLKHTFTNEWADADTALVHTVMLHIPDDEIEELVKRLKQYKRIVVGEIMERKRRRAGNPPVFNRDAHEYESLFGLKAETYTVPYPRYSTNLKVLVFNT